MLYNAVGNGMYRIIVAVPVDNFILVSRGITTCAIEAHKVDCKTAWNVFHTIDGKHNPPVTSRAQAGSYIAAHEPSPRGAPRTGGALVLNSTDGCS